MQAYAERELKKELAQQTSKKTMSQPLTAAPPASETRVAVLCKRLKNLAATCCAAPLLNNQRIRWR